MAGKRLPRYAKPAPRQPYQPRPISSRHARPSVARVHTGPGQRGSGKSKGARRSSSYSHLKGMHRAHAVNQSLASKKTTPRIVLKTSGSSSPLQAPSSAPMTAAQIRARRKARSRSQRQTLSGARREIRQRRIMKRAGHPSQNRQRPIRLTGRHGQAAGAAGLTGAAALAGVAASHPVATKKVLKGTGAAGSKIAKAGVRKVQAHRAKSDKGGRFSDFKAGFRDPYNRDRLGRFAPKGT